MIAFVIAIPLTWIFMYNWLKNYAFRIDMHWSYFLFPFLVIGAIALLTVSVQSVRAARANPVKSLKTE